jgi:hypothetical protein
LAQAAAAEASSSGFKYTTLEETKGYIAAHAKPVMTMEAALAQVAREDDGDYFWKDEAAYT